MRSLLPWALLLLGCSELPARFLPIPMPLDSQQGLLVSYGSFLPDSDASCTLPALAGAAAGKLLLDSGSPLSAFHGTQSGLPLRHVR